MQQDTAAPDAPSFMPTIVLAAFGGGALTSFLLWAHGAVLALASAPFGASVAASLAASTVYIARRDPRCAEPDDEAGGAQVRNHLGIIATSN